MILWLFLPLLASFANGQFVVLPDNVKATLEDPEETVEDCARIDIIPNGEASDDARSLLEQACTSQIKVRHHRNKRYMYPILSHGISASSMFSAFEEKRRLKEKNKKINEKLTELLGYMQEESLTVPFEKIQSLLQWNGAEFAFSFNYPVHLVADAWEAMVNKSLGCDAARRLELSVCGRTNPNRKWGEHKIAVSIGEFTTHGTIYKARDIPAHVVSINEKDVSVASCVFLATYYECQLSKNMSCTISDYKKCSEIVHFTPSKVFSRDIDGGTKIVAAEVKEYITFIEGEYATHPMDLSKHTVLSLPVGSYAKFNGVKIFGTATKNYDHFSLHHDADELPLRHGDLDKLEETEGKHPEIEKHRKHGFLEIVWSFLQEHVFWIVFGVFFTSFFVVVFSNWLMNYVAKKRGEQLRHEPVVSFANEQCYITF